MDKPITFNEWLGTQGNMVLLHANCCRIAFEGGQQSTQAKVEEQAQEIANLKSLIQGHELRHQQNLSIKQKLTRRSEELQKQLSEYIFVAETIDEMYVKEVQKSDELQKRVQFLEQELGAWKGKSIAAMINGMCKQCGKEPWQAIVSDKEGYALLHCFGCGANKYELVGEQALKGGG
ncbi:TPA: hypothetical protein JI089_03235 [Acinetobacter baumannii]|nr:hypothetical protein [Acinetobacter baumannii]